MKRVPVLPSVEKAVLMYYEKPLMKRKDIITLFGCSPSKASELKTEAMQQMEEDGIPVWNALAVDTETAYKAWGIDIGKLERQLVKLKKLQAIGVQI